MNLFIAAKKQQSGGYKPGLPSLNAMITAHDQTHAVRHHFHDLDRLSAETATQHLESFCLLAEIGEVSRLKKIRDYLSLWSERKPVPILLEENRRLETLRGKDAEERRALLERLAARQTLEKKLEHLSAAMMAKDRRIEELENIAEARGEKAQAERQERAAIESALRSAKKEIEK